MTSRGRTSEAANLGGMSGMSGNVGPSDSLTARVIRDNGPSDMVLGGSPARGHSASALLGSFIAWLKGLQHG